MKNLYSITNNNEFVSNSPVELETYPIVDAGQCTHRKLILKNGVGTFKVDTSNLSSGEKFSIKQKFYISIALQGKY